MTKISTYCEVTAKYVLFDENRLCLATSTPETPLRYVHGTGQMLATLETALSGHQAGDYIKVTLTPEEAYGPHRPELVFEAIKENLPPSQEVQVGMTLTPGGQQGKFSLKVVALTEKGALLDGNHPLAGKTVTWEITILSVEPPNIQRDEDHKPIRWVTC
ncbi:FKBP-type peptidyl-prolyl cis-trans isomerase [Halomonas vilamensis]|uniref:Peptidyl-prolyl cis-trans isomerase n=1 Tax=Vreelandella vilamensis TaxID=531309 RepID=A0ABU1H3Y1_9GAMM|nr:FKBP-type peptidyl-prolyl cis-trans isomerase [Halomonas vilamensis]MDR5898536.1 FKBP-type peptidyl-prolyl cis-trans isomerase [Halomonas vilamensis]